MNPWSVLSWLFLGLGIMLVVTASIGLVRLPDPYSRLNAVTKAATLAPLLVLAGAWLAHPGWYSAFETLLTAWFLMLTAPVTGHAIGRTLHRSAVPLGERARYDEREAPAPAAPTSFLRHELPERDVVDDESASGQGGSP